MATTETFEINIQCITTHYIIGVRMDPLPPCHSSQVVTIKAAEKTKQKFEFLSVPSGFGDEHGKW